MTQEHNFYNFTQGQSKKLGHFEIIHLFQYPVSHRIVFYTLIFFVFGLALCFVTSFTWLSIVGIVLLSVMFYFTLKAYRAWKALSPFGIALWGDVESMILKTVITPEMNEYEKNLFQDYLKKGLEENPQLKKYNFITLTGSKGVKFLHSFMSFDELQSCVNSRLSRESKTKKN